MTDTLSDFLLARISEWEDDARATAGHEAHQQWALNDAGDLNEGALVSYALFVLADCAAKRRIVTYAQRLEGATEDRLRYEADGLHFAARLLAQPYSGHADFDPAWKLD